MKPSERPAHIMLPLTSNKQRTTIDGAFGVITRKSFATGMPRMLIDPSAEVVQTVLAVATCIAAASPATLCVQLASMAACKWSRLPRASKASAALDVISESSHVRVVRYAGIFHPQLTCQPSQGTSHKIHKIIQDVNAHIQC